MRAVSGVIFLVYLAAGVVIANDHHYFANLHGVDAIVSAILAVVLWPLILLNVDLHIGGGKAGKPRASLLIPYLGATRMAGRRRRRHVVTVGRLSPRPSTRRRA
jgi:hypothetical protein